MPPSPRDRVTRVPLPVHYPTSSAQVEDEELLPVHQRIDNCRICETFVGVGFRKPLGLYRGTKGKVVIVGQGPGRSEFKHIRAFAGPAGKTLDRWLVACGNPEYDPRVGIYLTSLVKCAAPSTKFFKEMTRRCAQFLDEQLRLLAPSLIITLGESAFRAFSPTEEAYASSLCRPVTSSQNPL